MARRLLSWLLALLLGPGLSLHEGRADSRKLFEEKVPKRESREARPTAASSHRSKASSVSHKERAQVEEPGPTAPSTAIRPNFGKGPTYIRFLPYMKNLYDIDVAKSQFVADLVLTFEWKDAAAVAAVLPKGVEQLTIPLERARESIWLPDMKVSNRIGSPQLISSSVLLTDKGYVQKTDRIVATVLVPFALDNYPFDTQELYVNVASSAYMAHDVKLVPMETPNVSSIVPDAGNASSVPLYSSNATGPRLTNATLAAVMKDQRALFAKLDIFEKREFVLKDIRVITYDDADSTLHKSRGRITIEVSHRYGGFLLNSFLPMFFLQIVATGSFFFPIAGVFATPRTATVLAIQLVTMVFGARIGSFLPYDGSVTWVKTFNAVVQTQLFAFMCLQLACLHAAHNLKAAEAAHRMNEDCKVLVIPMCLIINGLLFLPPLVQVPIPWHAGIMAFAMVISYGAVFSRVVAQIPSAPKLPESAASS